MVFYFFKPVFLSNNSIIFDASIEGFNLLIEMRKTKS